MKLKDLEDKEVEAVVFRDGKLFCRFFGNLKFIDSEWTVVESGSWRAPRGRGYVVVGKDCEIDKPNVIAGVPTIIKNI